MYTYFYILIYFIHFNSIRPDFTPSKVIINYYKKKKTDNRDCNTRQHNNEKNLIQPRGKHVNPKND